MNSYIAGAPLCGAAIVKRYRVAILGATGAVGREMLRVIEERGLPVSHPRCLASAKSAGSRLEFCGEELIVEEASDASFKDIDIVLGASSAGVARRFAPAIKASGALFIDNSSAFRLDDGVPLIVPEINGKSAYSHHGVISNPNCTTAITLMAVAPLARISPVKRLIASTYQAASGAGCRGIEELDGQMRELSSGGEAKCSVFPRQLACNLIPRIGDALENGYTSEEMKLQNEGRKILGLPDMRVSCTCVRAPIARSHSISAAVETERCIPLDEARAAIAAFPGVVLEDDVKSDVYPTPLGASGKDAVFVGRIRKSLVFDNAIELFCSGDQLRKGAAANAVSIAELFM